MASSINLHKNRLFMVLGIESSEDLKRVARSLGVRTKDLQFYNDSMILPNSELLHRIIEVTGYSELEIKIRLGVLDSKLLEWISQNPEIILNSYTPQISIAGQMPSVKYTTEYGQLYQADCIELMRSMEDESVDLIFADPPFNLGKQYESGIDDYLSEQKYLKWTEDWLLECVRILAPGGSLFVYNIPYWQTHISGILNKYLNFRHWIAIYMRGLMPVAGRLHPSHYGLLYYVKGEKARVFNKQRIPMSTCRHCGGEIHDYGGKKKNLDPNGLSIADVWTDINPVRHKKFKNREANELPLKLMHRVISLASNPGDRVFDPFGGSGTTYVVAEYLRRNWIGVEVGEVDTIIDRLENKSRDQLLLEEIESESNILFTEAQKRLRQKNGFWTLETLNSQSNNDDTEQIGFEV